MLFHFVFIHDLFEISQTFCCVIEDILFPDALAHYLVEDDLEANGDAATLEVVVVVFADLFDLGVLLLLTLLDA